MLLHQECSTLPIHQDRSENYPSEGPCAGFTDSLTIETKYLDISFQTANSYDLSPLEEQEKRRQTPWRHKTFKDNCTKTGITHQNKHSSVTFAALTTTTSSRPL